MKKIIGVTGGSGTGKGVVSEIFAENGAFCIDADEIYKQTIKPGMPALNEIKEAFGESVILKNGELNRAELAKIVFNSKQELHKLDSITHKYIIEKIEKEILKASENLIIIDAPTLFESGLNRICDVTIGVLAGQDLRIKRIKERDGLSCEKAKERVFAQKEDSFYKEKCDYIIENNGGLDILKKAVYKIFKEVSGEKN